MQFQAKKFHPANVQPVKKRPDLKGAIGIVAALAVFSFLFVALAKRRKKTKAAPAVASGGETEKEVSLQEKEKIRQRMKELGKRGGKKSVEARRRKKGSSNVIPAQSDLRPDGNGENMADEAAGEVASEA